MNAVQRIERRMTLEARGPRRIRNGTIREAGGLASRERIDSESGGPMANQEWSDSGSESPQWIWSDSKWEYYCDHKNPSSPGRIRRKGLHKKKTASSVIFIYNWISEFNCLGNFNKTLAPSFLRVAEEAPMEPPKGLRSQKGLIGRRLGNGKSGVIVFKGIKIRYTFSFFSLSFEE